MECCYSGTRRRSVALVIVVGALCIGVGVGAGVGVGEVSMEQVGEILGQVVEQHLTGCHLVLLTITLHSPLMSIIVSFLERAGLWRLCETRVVVLGGTGRVGVEEVLLHHSLRNILHAIYLTVQPSSRKEPNHRLRIVSDFTKQSEAQALSQLVDVYRRCMYCSGGMVDVQYVSQWNLTSSNHTNLPNASVVLHGEDELWNFNGHELRYVAVRFLPYVDFTRNNDQDYIVTLKDSIDYRIISALAGKLNFSYIVRAEPDRIYGVEKNGKFNGMLGQLEREESDMFPGGGPNSERLRVAEFSTAYPSEMLTLVSLKPTLLPQHLVLVRPFAREVWVGVWLGMVAWVLALWVLQRAWVWATGVPGVQLISTFLFGWGALMERPPSDPSINISGQMVVGWWLVYCLIIVTGFKSSLIAALTVQSKSEPIETLQDMVNADGWRWGIEPWLMTGLPFVYFSTHPDPVMQTIFAGLEVKQIDDGMKQILKGGFSMIGFKNYLTIEVFSRYADSRGYTPLHISEKPFSITATFGWGYRRGAPFYRHFQLLIQQLQDAGIIQYWSDDVIAQRIKEYRAAGDLNTDIVAEFTEENKEIALGLNHLQGAFYLLLLGITASALILLAEVLAHSH